MDRHGLGSTGSPTGRPTGPAFMRASQAGYAALLSVFPGNERQPVVVDVIDHEAADAFAGVSQLTDGSWAS